MPRFHIGFEEKTLIVYLKSTQFSDPFRRLPKLHL